MLNVDDILADGGAVAKRLDNYEQRDEQLQMAAGVAESIANKRHLIVEAGTGVGKSLGYLVPAILSLDANQKSKDETCLLYTSPSPRDRQKSRMPSSA